MFTSVDQVIKMFGGIQNFQNKVRTTEQELLMQGINPQQKVQELLNSGQMSQEQFNQFRAIANLISGRNM